MDCEFPLPAGSQSYAMQLAWCDLVVPFERTANVFECVNVLREMVKRHTVPVAR